ncbi:MAG: adenosylcobinamide-GDP ribazoletransferase [Rhodospirillales bacterium]|jgi:adenosylcobinamide-GDP ribazoletransferase
MPDETPAPPPPPETPPPPAEPPLPGRPWNWLGEIRIALVFLTVLPVRLRPADLRFGVSHAVRAFPVAGLAVGAVAAGAFVLAELAGLPSLVAALVALVAAVLVSGGLHEDGLADTVDGLSGGRTPARSLEIMRDARIGAHGALALILALMLRAGAIGYAGVTLDTVCALIAAAIASRTAVVPVMYLLPPARPDGVSAAAGTPHRSRAADSVAIGILMTALALAPVLQPLTILLVIAGAAAGAALPALLARRRLGGQTGDVLGAVQQSAEICFLLVFIADP